MTSPQTLLKAWNLRARKELGQNFLCNPAVADQIVTQARLTADDVVLEIGAGLGAVTIAAALRAGRVIAVEKDRHLVPLLRAELLVHGLAHVEIVERDIRTIDLEELRTREGRNLVVLGNLPYHISSQVMVKLIEERRHIHRGVLMFQKELAQRLCADPGSKAYGRLSVMLQYCADVVRLRDLRADQFYPRPKIDSSVLGISFKTRIDHPVNDERLFARVVQSAFGQRRKTLRNALSGGLLPLDGDAAAGVLAMAEIDSRRRAETLSVTEFVHLTNCIADYLLSDAPIQGLTRPPNCPIR